MGCSTYLGLGWRYQPLAPGHPTSICDIGVNNNDYCSFSQQCETMRHSALRFVSMYLQSNLALLNLNS